MTDAPYSPLAKDYDFAEVEPRRYAQWTAARVFHEEPDPARPAFVISMPPPNITGPAHIGHGSTYTPMDVLTRYHRMLGENADWIPGQDHAAIATESVVIRELAKSGLTRDGLGRAAFIDRVWEWREQYGGRIYEQFKALGFGADWERGRFTLDAGLSAAVVRVFVDLYNDGLIYRGTRLVNWDPKAQSTLSDAEVESELRSTFLWHVRYRSADGGEGVVIATTRPETMFADVAVAVHPHDARYAQLIGSSVRLPLTDRLIPIVGDSAVDPAFGTGAVKVTPAHDATDYDIGLRHDLAMPTVIGFDGRLTGDVPAAYAGVERFAARAMVARDLAASGDLVREEPYTTNVPVSSRTGEVVEPLLSLQWFCKMDELARPALDAYRSGKLRFVPERFGRTYEQWLENIRDWNVSRQVWWGHQLPVWYTPDDDVVVALSQAEAERIARERFGTVELRRDPDTLDTWFSSGLWPFSILGWPDATPELQHWYPNAVMITGREIIFLWVARMVMLGLRFAGGIPFGIVFITPLVFDINGRKMSKSLGNAIDPLEMIARYGADGFRLGTMMQMRLESQELRFDERVCDQAKRFNQKLWNALKYVRSLPEGLPRAAVLPPRERLTLADRWILTELNTCITDVTHALDTFAIGTAANVLHDFSWYKFCDWYLESTKIEAQRATRGAVLSFVLNTLMRALHPIEPFITEEVWQLLPHDGQTIVTASWPDPAEIPRFPAEAELYEAFIASVERIRNTKVQLELKPNEKVRLRSAPLPAELGALYVAFVRAEIDVDPALASDGSAQALLGQIDVLADPAVLRERYVRQIAKLEAEVERLERKLDGDFIAKAPPDKVAAERAKLGDYQHNLARTQALLAAL